MTSWFRSWHGAPTDNAYLAIAKRAGVAAGIVSAVVWALIDYASQQDERGSIEGFDIESYSAFSGFEEEQIGAIINALKDKKKIVENRISSWERRQPKREDDGAAERKAKQREKEKLEHCHALSRTVTHTDTDTDTEQKELVAVSAETPPEPKIKNPKGKRLPPDWVLPVEWGEWALGQGYSREEVLKEEEAFRDYWIAKAGADAVKLDWQATWRGWIRRKGEFKK